MASDEEGLCPVAGDNRVLIAASVGNTFNRAPFLNDAETDEAKCSSVTDTTSVLQHPSIQTKEETRSGIKPAI